MSTRLQIQLLNRHNQLSDLYRIVSNSILPT